MIARNSSSASRGTGDRASAWIEFDRAPAGFGRQFLGCILIFDGRPAEAIPAEGSDRALAGPTVLEGLERAGRKAA